MLTALAPGHLPATVVGELVAQVQVAASRTPGSPAFRVMYSSARRRPPVGEQLLEGERGVSAAAASPATPAGLRALRLSTALRRVPPGRVPPQCVFTRLSGALRGHALVQARRQRVTIQTTPTVIWSAGWSSLDAPARQQGNTSGWLPKAEHGAPA